LVCMAVNSPVYRRIGAPASSANYLRVRVPL
jgi:hypothetical protein